MLRKGFTLIELLVVIVIIGILVAIALPNFIKVKDKAKEAEVKQNLHAIQLALERYAVDSPAQDYPLFPMGGDWTDTCTVWQSWIDSQNLDPGNEISNPTRLAGWYVAPQWMGDSLIMESYMPQYPANPFMKERSQNLVPTLRHTYPNGNGGMTRVIGGLEGSKMVEIFGPVNGPANDAHDQPYGDMCIHHIFNNPPYNQADILKMPQNGWVNPSGNRLLVGNFSYYPRQGEGGIGWAWLNAMSDCVGYTLAGYGALRTAGQDVYNRNGDYKGRYRAGASSNSLPYTGVVPGLPAGSSAPPSVTQNNGGSDTVKDGVIVTLDSGVDKKTTRVNPDTTEGEDRT